MSLQGKKILTVPLIIISIAIWGYIIMRVIAYLTSPNEEIVEAINTDSSFNIENLQTEKKASGEFRYEKLERDPFKLTSNRIASNSEPQQIVETPFTPEPQLYYKINGIVMNETGGVVILEDLVENTVLFLKEGDSYKSIKIKHIAYTKVSLLEGKAEKEIEIR